MGIDKVKILGEGPYPLPMDDFQKKINLSMDTDICIIIPKVGIDFPDNAQQHVHDSFEFFIPSSTMPYLSLEKQCYIGEKGKIWTVNSGQYHGPHKPMLNKHFISINIDTDFLNEIAYSVYGKANVYFKQGNYSFDNRLRELISLFTEECSSFQHGRQLVLKSISTQIAVYLLRQIDNNMPFLLSSSYNTSKANIDKSIEYLRDQYDEEYSLEEVAKIAHLSPYYFIKTFKSYTGKTPYEYLLCLRVNKAKELLTSRDFNITEVSYKCGFNNLSNFITFFKRKVGVTPYQYRKIMLNR
ncbi:helix-turn-helix domain-containing protein [Alkaliphilus peptidifermentans]|uniref:Helix-turn-helix domain-containing protein n=1 Tax=Alkaliphilus peptidifermentans DSM 18978 TaxID=1120976 RepID=A0A1G5JSQ6_9FIRM|nr:AraC family transcriptional regulator [Alkaliphilus peptidifermentans]SCY91367.1 Helix-turn-helix domain-containing protein [Alkaliphilus peptidifermentans DSM 18978]